MSIETNTRLLATCFGLNLQAREAGRWQSEAGSNRTNRATQRAVPRSEAERQAAANIINLKGDDHDQEEQEDHRAGLQ